MALFSIRDRIAIAAICALILAGWGARLVIDRHRPDDLRVIRGAAAVPPALTAGADSTAGQQKTPPSTTPLDINRATAAELETLPGIGAVKARAIVEHRTRNGPFARTRDIVNVKGIGSKTFERIAPLITAGGKE